MVWECGVLDQSLARQRRPTPQSITFPTGSSAANISSQSLSSSYTLLLQTRILTPTSALEFRYFWRLRRPQCGESLTHRRRPNTIIPRWLRRRSRSRAFLLRNDFQWPSDMARNWISGEPVDTRPALSSDSDYCWETIG